MFRPRRDAESFGGFVTATNRQELYEATALETDPTRSKERIAAALRNLAPSGMRTLSILLADHHPVLRRGLRALLEAQPRWKVVAEAANDRDAVEKATRLRPDLVILDISLPELNGVDVTQLILKAVPHTRVLILTMHNAEDLIARALAAGAQGYVLKSDSEADLVSAVEALSNDRTFFTSAASELVLDNLRRDDRKGRSQRVVNSLTVREREIVQLLAEGNSNKEVAARLSISVRTVENHRAKIRDKLHLRSFSELVRYAIRNKLYSVETTICEHFVNALSA
jgi:DNA-binding NarL/FixJ family response regulator